MGAKIRLLQMYGSNNSAVPAPVMNMRGEFVHRWRRPGDEEFTNVPGLLDAKSYEKTRTPWWNDKPYEFAGTIWNMYDNSDLRVVSGSYLKCSSMTLRYNIAPEWLKKTPFSNLSLSLNALNLFTISAKELKGQDPSQAGFAKPNLSVRPSYTFQFNVTF